MSVLELKTCSRVAFCDVRFAEVSHRPMHHDQRRVSVCIHRMGELKAPIHYQTQSYDQA